MSTNDERIQLKSTFRKEIQENTYDSRRREAPGGNEGSGLKEAEDSLASYRITTMSPVFQRWLGFLRFVVEVKNQGGRYGRNKGTHTKMP
jgi:hypothetical protein